MSSDAMRHLRRTPPWVVVAVAVMALVLTWLGWKIVGMNEPDSLTVEMAAEEFPTAAVSYSVGPFGLGGSEHPILAEEVALPKVAAHPATLTVTPLGQPNTRSRGKEIWLVEVSSEYARVGGAEWKQMSLPAPWVVSGESALNAQGAPVPLPVGLEAGAYIEARFVTHAWSGRVRIDAGGQGREIDLYSRDSGQGTFRLLLPVAPGTNRRVVKTVPRAAGDLTLRFPDGAQTVQLEGAERRGASRWTWNRAGTDDLVLGPGVKVLGRDAGGVTIGVPEGGGWVRFAETAASYWTPRPKDLAVVLGAWLVVIGLGLFGLAVAGALAGAVALVGSFVPSASAGASARERWHAGVDAVLLIAVSAWLFVLVGGALLSAREVAEKVGDAKASRATGATVTTPRWDNLVDWAPASPRVWQWWAGRPLPRPDGEDYLRVLSRESGETIADILGVEVARTQAAGMPVKQVIIPRDLKALYGQEPFYVSQGVGGRESRIRWQVLQDVATFFTDVPYVERAYDPVLTEAQFSALPGVSESEFTGSALSVVKAPEGASGTWVLYALPTTPRTYALVPIEASPEGQRP